MSSGRTAACRAKSHQTRVKTRLNPLEETLMKKLLGAAALAATTALATPAGALDSLSWDMQST